MGEVRYSVNGKYFKDFGISISDSEGLFDALKRKKVNTYDWAEYHGQSVDLSKPKFEAREITLKGFVIGNNWEQMKSNFDAILREFQKSGTQRLLIEPFGMKALPYEVYLEDSVKLEKRFKEGKMFGTFAIKLIEPNPVKKVLKVVSETLSLSYDSKYETDIFWGDGTKQTFYGNVSEIKDFGVPSYQSSGYSIAEQSTINNGYYETITTTVNGTVMFSVVANISTATSLKLYVIGRKVSENSYVLVAESNIVTGVPGNNILKAFKDVNFADYGKFIFKVLDGNGLEISGISFSNPRIELTEILGEWQDMSGKDKYVIIAGNIEDLTNVTHNAEELWIKL